MGIQEYLEKIKSVQKIILSFINDDSNIEVNFGNLKLLLRDQKFQEKKHDLKLILHLISKISNYHHRYTNFYNKIEKILQLYQREIQSNFSNSTIFHIFKGNKRILLYLIEEKIILMDKEIFSIITNIKFQTSKYPQYFYYEIKHFLENNNEENNRGKA